MSLLDRIKSAARRVGRRNQGDGGVLEDDAEMRARMEAWGRRFHSWVNAGTGVRVEDRSFYGWKPSVRGIWLEREGESVKVELMEGEEPMLGQVVVAAQAPVACALTRIASSIGSDELHSTQLIRITLPGKGEHLGSARVERFSDFGGLELYALSAISEDGRRLLVRGIEKGKETGDGWLRCGGLTYRVDLEAGSGAAVMPGGGRGDGFVLGAYDCPVWHNPPTEITIESGGGAGFARDLWLRRGDEKWRVGFDSDEHLMPNLLVAAEAPVVLALLYAPMGEGWEFSRIIRIVLPGNGEALQGAKVETVLGNGKWVPRWWPQELECISEDGRRAVVIRGDEVRDEAVDEVGCKVEYRAFLFDVEMREWKRVEA